MWSTFSKLYQARLATPLGIYRLLRALSDKGSNLMVLLDVAARTHGDAIVLAEASQTTSYRELYDQVRQLAYHLQDQYNVGPGQRIALAGRNHGDWVRALFACSYLGADLYLLPTGLPKTLLMEHLNRHAIDGLIYDHIDWEAVHWSSFEGWRLLFQHLTLPSVHALAHQAPKRRFRLRRRSNGQLVVLTGGTTGIPKGASRTPSVQPFLAPFLALLRQLDLQAYHTTYIATPLYHGFGLSGLLVAVTLGAKIVLTKRFKIEAAAPLLVKHQAQVWVVVPTQLQRLLELDKLQMLYTKLILSGGAALPPDLPQQAQALLPKVRVANLYGTSEAGFCFLATPEDLNTYPSTIGRPIKGAAVQLRDETGELVPIDTVGELYINASWSAEASTQWTPTGDLALANEAGFYFLRGRTNERVVSGGVNVFPEQVQQLIAQHPAIQACTVIGTSDELFGERLRAYLVLHPYANLSKEELRDWLSLRATPAQQPRDVIFVEELPLTALGKVDKKALE